MPEVSAKSRLWLFIIVLNFSKNLLDPLGIQMATRLTELEGFVQDLVQELEEVMGDPMGEEALEDAGFNDDPDY